MSETISKLSVSADLSTRLIDAALAHAASIELPISVAICDESGILKGFHRADNAALLSVEVALSKARSAVGFNMATHDWYDFIKEDEPLKLGAPNLPDLIVFGGGYPIKVAEQMVGGIGVSGGHYTQDMACAEAALKIL